MLWVILLVSFLVIVIFFAALYYYRRRQLLSQPARCYYGVVNNQMSRICPGEVSLSRATSYTPLSTPRSTVIPTTPTH